MHPTDPPLRPSDPEAFRRQVYGRAARLRRRRIATAMTGAVIGATVVAVLFGSYLPLIRPAGGHIAIGTAPPSSSVTSTGPATATGSSTSTVPSSTSSPTSTQAPPTTTTTGSLPPTTTPPTTVPTEATSPTTTVVTSTTIPTPGGAVLQAACGQPAAPARSAAPTALAQSLVGTWAQCAGPSIFGTTSADALEILANGTWRQLGHTPGGWVPLQGKDDSGTWELLPPPTSVTTTTFAIVRFVATPPASTGGSSASMPSTRQLPTPQTWIARVMLTGAPQERAQFADAGIVANYSLLVPSSAGGPTATP